MRARVLKRSSYLLLGLLPLIFGQEEESFGCCPLKEVQGDGDLAGVYYLVDTDQPFPDVCDLDDCTYKKEGNGDEKFCFKASNRYESTCSASGEGYADGEPTAKPSAEPTAETSGEPSAEPSAEPTTDAGCILTEDTLEYSCQTE